MEITIRTVGKCKVLDCHGKLSLGPATATFRKTFREAVQDGTSKVVLNVKEVAYIDSSGMGELISSYIHIKNQGGKLVFLNLKKKIQMLFSFKGIIFEYYDDEQKALEGFEQPRTQSEKEEQ